MLKAVIFDRDGTLNQTAPETQGGYVLHTDELVLRPGVKEALLLLKKNHIRIFVFTQQKCVGKGLLSKKCLHQIHSHMQTLLDVEGTIDGFYYCPHWPEDDEKQGKELCICAKPQPGMLLQILEEHDLKPEEVVVIGDTQRDYESAEAAGLRFHFVKSDNPQHHKLEEEGHILHESVLHIVRGLL